jgi:hypothetical protein
MALEGPSFSSSISFILSAAATSITIGLVLYQKRFLLHEVIGPGIMVCVTFDQGCWERGVGAGAGAGSAYFQKSPGVGAFFI